MGEYVNEKLKQFNKEIEGKRIAIIGIGVSNIPLLEYFYTLNCSISVFDNREKSEIDNEVVELIEKYKIRTYFGKGNLKFLYDYDYIFRSPTCRPDTPEIIEEVQKGAILTSEIEQVIRLTPSTVIGVTGTEGKTTTTSLITAILKKGGKKVFLGGNIGTPLFAKIGEMKPEDYVVLELSSFQLFKMDYNPHIAVVTNMMPDHLNVHKDMKEYIDSKKNIFNKQKEEDILVINYDNEITKEFYKDANGKVRYFSHKELLDDGIIFDEQDKIIKMCEDGVRKHLIKQKDMILRGEHNCENACAAISATLGIVSLDDAVSAIEEFKPVEHRLEFVRKINNIEWYNDSICTSPASVIAGINSFDEDVVLIAGGYDKGLDYTEIAKPIIEKVSKLILMGDTADKIERAVIDELLKQNKTLPIYRCKTLDEVVNKAIEVSVEGEVVLFSPASASFDMFKNFADRGNKFKAVVNSK